MAKLNKDEVGGTIRGFTTIAVNERTRKATFVIDVLGEEDLNYRVQVECPVINILEIPKRKSGRPSTPEKKFWAKDQADFGKRARQAARQAEKEEAKPQI